ncbi:hypothetical protein [Sphingomonas aracearum]|uniref:hypothetical protein n=1 Tax=Sphingomonas aracearum TaxID=2283317 RepID=UPI0011C01AAC|nr:hypothetical protein [Sphingomonas aracearum]
MDRLMIDAPEGFADALQSRFPHGFPRNGLEIAHSPNDFTASLTGDGRVIVEVIVKRKPVLAYSAN